MKFATAVISAVLFLLLCANTLEARIDKAATPPKYEEIEMRVIPGTITIYRGAQAWRWMEAMLVDKRTGELVDSRWSSIPYNSGWVQLEGFGEDMTTLSKKEKIPLPLETDLAGVDGVSIFTNVIFSPKVTLVNARAVRIINVSPGRRREKPRAATIEVQDVFNIPLAVASGENYTAYSWLVPLDDSIESQELRQILLDAILQK